ncbi:UBact family ubiquitin protein [Armatimonas sp.]|uniref:UBact family ubiquitin protein n=1 Tax=Armatimonas sp. TaxID=1872638 RepID=UPI00374FF5AC
MPPDVTASEADNKPEPIPPPLPFPKEGESEKIPPKVLERMRRVSPDMARRYNQRGGQ